MKTFFNSTFKVWTNNAQSSHVKIFLSTLSLLSEEVLLTSCRFEANIWCIEGTENLENLEKDYATKLNLPNIVVIGDEDMIVNNCKIELTHHHISTPVNLKSINSWLTGSISEQHINPVNGIHLLDDNDESYLWMFQPFKLNDIPQVYLDKTYANNVEIDQLCKFMHNNWVEFDDLLTSNVEETVIYDILINADESNSIVYENSNTPTESLVSSKLWQNVSQMLSKDVF